MRIPADVADKIGYYVYLYVNPRNGKPFYVGKGKGSRVLAHLAATGRSRKARALKELRRRHLKPRLDILCHSLPDDATALRVEAAVIDALGMKGLVNEVRGWHTTDLGRMPLRDLLAFYRAKPVRVADLAILIRINRLYRYGMSAEALYEATRSAWRLNPARAQKAKFALAVFHGIVREVYAIKGWNAAGTARYRTREGRDLGVPGRWEFTGQVASPRIRRRYVDKSVRRYLPQGLQSPVVYCNC